MHMLELQIQLLRHPTLQLKVVCLHLCELSCDLQSGQVLAQHAMQPDADAE
jgi:hypothetical protein